MTGVAAGDAGVAAGFAFLAVFTAVAGWFRVWFWGESRGDVCRFGFLGRRWNRNWDRIWFRLTDEPRAERIKTVVHLGAVIESVAIGVGVDRTGSQRVLNLVGQPIIVVVVAWSSFTGLSLDRSGGEGSARGNINAAASKQEQRGQCDDC